MKKRDIQWSDYLIKKTMKQDRELWFIGAQTQMSKVMDIQFQVISLPKYKYKEFEMRSADCIFRFNIIYMTNNN